MGNNYGHLLFIREISQRDRNGLGSFYLMLPSGEGIEVNLIPTSSKNKIKVSVYAPKCVGIIRAEILPEDERRSLESRFLNAD